ncbi:MAG: hypothetical protein ACE5EM_07735 [Sphingomonadales bacterium]
MWMRTALSVLMVAHVSTVCAQQTDPADFPSDIIRDKDTVTNDRKHLSRPRAPGNRFLELVAEGKIEEGLAALRARPNAACGNQDNQDNQDCHAENIQKFVLFMWLSSPGWPAERFHSLMQEARGLIERVDGVEKHSLMFEWYLTNGNYARDQGDLAAYEGAVKAAHQQVDNIRAEGEEFVSLAADYEISWLTHWASLKKARNEPDVAFEILQ